MKINPEIILTSKEKVKVAFYLKDELINRFNFSDEMQERIKRLAIPIDISIEILKNGSIISYAYVDYKSYPFELTEQEKMGLFIVLADEINEMIHR